LLHFGDFFQKFPKFLLHPLFLSINTTMHFGFFRNCEGNPQNVKFVTAKEGNNGALFQG
jgi:hypothetical protein